MKNIFGLYIGLAVFTVGCGDGDFRLNPAGGSLSQLGQGGVIADNAFNFFQTNIYPLLTSTTNPAKSCTGGACHSINTSTPKFFQIDAASVINTYNWAGARKATVQIGTYADTSALTLQQQKNTSPAHNAFGSWTETEKALIDTWVDKAD